MIDLITFPPGWGEPCLSPFGTKAIYLLNMAGVPWRREETLDPRKYPQKKLPAIRVDGRTIGDSDNIRLYLIEIGHDVDAHLSVRLAAERVAWTRLAEEHLYYQQVADRWTTPEVWPHLKRDYFGALPFPARNIVPRMLRRNLISGLNFMGHGRQSPDMRLMRLAQDLEAIKVRLGDQLFLFGDQPSSVDASLAGVLGGLRASPISTPTSALVRDDIILSNYVDRMAKTVGTSDASA